MRRFLRDNGLTLVFLGLFLLALAGQSVAGWVEFNDNQLAERLATSSYPSYLLSSDFAVDVAENWQSEYLQFFLYVVATVWLVQRGSTESKEVGDEGPGSDEEQRTGAYAEPGTPRRVRSGGLLGRVYASSLALVMGALFAGSWLAQSIAGHAAYNAQQLGQLQAPVTWLGYVSSADFWSRTLQNWQSEFLAVASMAVFSVYLRQRGSSESKPVGAPHDETGSEG